MKIGIIRCQQIEDLCCGTTCLAVAREGTKAFEPTGPVEVVGFVTCGGCPGKRAVPRAKMLADRKAKAIVLASCMGRGTPIGFPCPHFEQISEAVKRQVGPDIQVIDWTH